MKREKTYLVGVDAGVSTFSLAFWNCTTRVYEEFYTGTVDGALDYLLKWEIRNNINRGYYGVVVEDPNQDGAFFDGWPTLETQIKMYKFNRAQLKGIESVYRKQMKIAQNVGQNKMVAQQFIDFLQSTHIGYILIAPSKRTKVLQTDKSGEEYRLKGIALRTANMATKTNAGEFQLITGHIGKTNGHQRDAATLVHDRTLKWFSSVQLITMN